MIIKTKVSLKEYVKLMYGLAYRKPIMLFLIFVALALITWIVCYHLGVFNLPKPVIYQYITLILICVVQPIAIYITIRKNYYSSNHLRETLKMEFTQNEIKITAESFYMEVYWDKMFKIVEQANWFLIYQNNLSAIIIPKKDFHNNEIELFKEILTAVKGIPVSLKK
jgi:hypothetical protein